MKKMMAVTLALGMTCLAIRPFMPDIRRYLRIRSM